MTMGVSCHPRDGYVQRRLGLVRDALLRRDRPRVEGSGQAMGLILRTIILVQVRRIARRDSQERWYTRA